MIKIDLSGKTALVTGATGQLGRVMARTLASAGANVIIHYRRNKSQADTLVRKIKHMGREALAVQGDVTDENSVKKMRYCIISELRMPDIVVCNAVIKYDWKNVLEQSLNDYESQFRSCTLHVVLMAQVFVPTMIKNGNYILDKPIRYGFVKYIIPKSRKYLKQGYGIFLMMVNTTAPVVPADYWRIC